MSAKLMFLDVQIETYFAQPSVLFLRENKRRAKIKGIKVSKERFNLDDIRL